MTLKTEDLILFMLYHLSFLFFFKRCFFNVEHSSMSIFKITVFIFGCVGYLLLHKFSLAAASRGYSLASVHKLLAAAASLAVEHGL